MASQRQRRKHKKERRHAPKPIPVGSNELKGSVEPLAYSREQAARLLRISLATLTAASSQRSPP